MGRPRRTTCSQYVDEADKSKSKDTTTKVDDNDLQATVFQLVGVIKEMQEQLSSLSQQCIEQISTNFIEINKCSNKVTEVTKQVNDVHQYFLRKSVIVISYEDTRNSHSYCCDVLTKLKIARNDISSADIIFMNDRKTIYRVELLNEFKVNQVMYSKKVLRGSKVYIHRPYTDAEKKTRQKQIQIAKDICKDQNFRIYKDMLYTGSLVYQWNNNEDTFSLSNPTPENKVSSDAVKENTRQMPAVLSKVGEKTNQSLNEMIPVQDETVRAGSSGIPPKGFLAKSVNKEKECEKKSDSEWESDSSEPSNPSDGGSSSESSAGDFREAMRIEMEEARLELCDTLRKSFSGKTM